MPVVGEAHIIVRAITTNVAKDINKGFNGVSGSGGKNAEKAGQDLSSRFMSGWNKNMDTNPFTKLSNALKEMNPSAEQGYNSINQLIVAGYKGATMASVFGGSIGVIIGALVSLVAAAAGAATALIAVVGLFVSMKAATAVAKMAFNGVGEAVQQATQQQKTHAQTLRDVREELQQLKFDAEDAALSEESAAIALEKAREGLARTADLPADSRARREAELAYKQAELNYRRAKDRSADLNKELKTGAKARAKAAANDPYANLTETQKSFAKFLVKLQPIFKTLREAVAKGFLPLLQAGLTKLMTSGTFNDIFNGIKNIGAALGKASKVLFDFFSSAEAGRYLREIFDMISGVVKEFGPILSKFFKSFLKILAASAPITQRLAKFISKLLGDFNALLDRTGDIGLRRFFITAADMAGKFGKIFGNIFGGFAKIVEANFGPGTGGDYLLNWLIEATQGFGTMGKSGGQLKQFFNDVAVNAKKMFSGIGSIIKQIVIIGADPNIGEFFVRIKKAAPAFSSILKKAGQALPTVADLIIKIVEIVDKLTDNAAIENFFKTLLAGADKFYKLISNPVIQSITSFTGQIHAVTLGILELYKKGKPLFDFLYTGFRKVNGAVGGIFDFFRANKETIKNIFGKDAVKTVKTLTGSVTNMKDRIAKTMASFKKSAEFVKFGPKLAKGQADGRSRDYTGVLNNTRGAATMKNVSEKTRKLLAEDSGALSNFWGKVRLQYEMAMLRMKLYFKGARSGFAKMKVQGSSTLATLDARFTQMTKSTNKSIAAFGRLGKAMTFMLRHPLILAITLLVAAFALLYTKNEKFRNAINDTFKPALDALGEAFRVIMLALQPVINAFKVLMKTLMGGENGDGQGPLVKFFIMLTDIISQLIQMLAPLIAQLVTKLAPVIEQLILALVPIVEVIMKIWFTIQGALMKVIMALVPIILKLVTVLVDMLMPVFDALIQFLLPIIKYIGLLFELIGAGLDLLMTGDMDTFQKKFAEIGQSIVQTLADIFTGFVNLIISLLNLLLKVMINSGVLSILADIVKAVSGGTIDIKAMVNGGLIPSMPRIQVPQLFAEGGVVSPSSGGTLGILAEAGKPERVEPLDPDGLSKRDKAMIQMMGGGNGGINVTVHGSPGMDVNALAAEVSRRLAFQMRKGAV